MKCVHCEHNSRRRERKAFMCPKCLRPYALDPKDHEGWTDYLLLQAIGRVSHRGAVKFCDGHLYQEIRRRRGRKLSGSSRLLVTLGLFTACGVLSAVALVSLIAFFVVLLMVVGAGTAAWRWHRSTPLASPPWHVFANARRLYIEAHGRPDTLIERRFESPATPALSSAAASPLPEEELAHYSFDRAVICERPEMVDLLIANQFHFENNCAVLGADGYPPERFELVRRMLRNNPRLLVLVLHDATVEGCRLAHRLRHDPEWFKDYGTVVDVGLRPAHHPYFKRLHEAIEGPPVFPGEGLSEAEARWLERNRLSLDVVLPAQIIKRLFKAITVAEQGAGAAAAAGASVAAGADGGAADILVFGSYAHSSDGGGDSFG